MVKIKYPVIDGKKNCSVCQEMKPIAEFPKTRYHYGSKCKKCKSIYSKEYRQRPEVKIASREYVQLYRSFPEKRALINKNARLSRARATQEQKDRRNRNRREWAAKEKLKAVNYKGGKCIICGYNKCIAALDFHHLNPLEKEGYGTGALKSHKTFEQNKTEIDKCILVCVRCHREIHAGITVYE